MSGRSLKGKNMNRMWWCLICVGVLAGSTGCRTCCGDRYRLTNRDHCDTPPARPVSNTRDDLGQLNRMRTAAEVPACAAPTTALQPVAAQPSYPNPGYQMQGYQPPGYFPSHGPAQTAPIGGASRSKLEKSSMSKALALSL